MANSVSGPSRPPGQGSASPEEAGPFPSPGPGDGKGPFIGILPQHPDPSRATVLPRTAMAAGNALGALARNARRALADDDAAFADEAGSSSDETAARWLGGATSESAGAAPGIRAKDAGAPKGMQPGGPQAHGDAPASSGAQAGPNKPVATATKIAPVPPVRHAVGDPARVSAGSRIVAWGIAIAAVSVLATALWLLFAPPPPSDDTGARTQQACHQAAVLPVS